MNDFPLSDLHAGLAEIGNERIALTLALPARGMPEILAFGPFARGGVAPVAGRAMRINGTDRPIPSAVLLPTGGLGFFGWPAMCGHRDGRDFIAEFAGWTVTVDGDSATLEAHDAVAGLGIAILLQVFQSGTISMQTVVTNKSDATYTLDRCMAASMLAPDGPGEIGVLSGMWAREFHLNREPIPNRVWLQESRRGRTSHDRFPGIFVSAGDTVSAIHLGWSGNHCVAIDPLDDGRRLVHVGELFEPGEIRLDAGEGYRSPVAYMTAAFSMDEASRRLRETLQRDVMTFPDPAKPRPVLFNTWEGSYFKHDPEYLLRQAQAAARLGIERFVLDDGWFGRRDSDHSSLGDWSVDLRKYPDGLAPLVDGVRALGMEFGLWFEPEMVNPDSDLFRTHPDWALQVDGRPLLLARHQLVLDLSRPEVADYLFDAIDAMLSAHKISYVKWDMNRDLTHAAGRDGRAATARQTRAVYALLDRVRKEHPHLEIESCASGGGRADYGVLAYTQRLWTSDGTDALQRLETQHGAALFFPPAILGAHISATPNHQTGRRHTLSFRAVVALAYHLGMELDPLKLTKADAAEIAMWIALHKRLRPLLHAPGADFQLEPRDGRYVWGAAEADRVALFVAQGPQMRAEQPPPLRLDLPMLAAGTWRIVAHHPASPAILRISESQEALLTGQISFSTDTLRQSGLPLPMLAPESGMLLELERVDG